MVLPTIYEFRGNKYRREWRKNMPVARNMKELEKMVLDRMKKELPNATKEYCHKWYNNNSDIKEIVSETEFIQIANDAMHISMENGKLKAHIELFKGENIKEEHLGHMKILWEDFKSGYLDYVTKKIFKQK